MGSSEMEKSSKETKEPKTPTSQEQVSPVVAAPAGPVTPDWSGFQAYSPMPPHGYMASSPQAPHPYMWGVQHMMPPYGTPPHPYVMYPHGGIYAHPSMPPGSYPFSPFAMPSPNGVAAEASGNTPGSMEADGKVSEGKEKLPIKRSKGSLGSLNMITGKTNEAGKPSGAATNGGYSKSGESASEGSSEEGSDANSQNDSQIKSGSRQDSLEAGASHNGNAHGLQNGHYANSSMVNQPLSIVPISTAGTPGILPGPTTNLNIGMDYWGGATSAAIPAMRGQVSPPITGGTVSAGARDNVQSQHWLQISFLIRTKGSLKGKKESNQTENLLADPGYGNRRNVMSWHSVLKL
ncbi:bZIP transcription factor 16-like isoform X4 [Apium graveolens]|uniref:bZIP transcription factor 16-like isoform X4 n=1 Tax=Apium graveolens TaxID=4045 RepID=UPI003D7B1402